MNCHSANAHLGDLQWCLIAMSRLPGPHVLCCNPEYHQALRELVAGLPITIEDCSHVRPNSLDAWIASGLFERQGIRYQDNIDIIGFVQRYFNAMGLEAHGHTPFPMREDMLCDFPEIMNCFPSGIDFEPFRGILVINADPKSGQCPGYSSSEMDSLIAKLEDKGHSVCAIEKADLSLVQIGALSIHAKLIIGCATGPWWSAQNIWNKNTQRICMLHPMRLDYGSVPIVHAQDAAEVATILEGMGFL